MKLKKINWWVVVPALLLFFTVFLWGVNLGLRKGKRMGAAMGGIPQINLSGFNRTGLKYGTIAGLVDKEYVERVNIDSIAESLIPDLLQKLDPHSSYIPAREVAESTADLEGKFFGIGVVFNMLTDTIVIQNVVPGGPSSKVGIENGDRIMRIDGKSVAGQKIPSDEIIRRLRGEDGTPVTLGIARSGLDSLIDITVTRGEVAVNSVDAAFMISPGIGYIKLLRFSRTSHQEVVEAIDRLRKEGMKELILDLKGNGGGYLDQAILIANEFLPEGAMIVYTKGRKGITAVQKADGRGHFIGDNLIILINEGTASSSEIVSGALQDNDLGILIGRRTFGKGLVQQQIPLQDGSLLNLSIAHYHTPTGRNIQRSYRNGSEEYYKDFIDRIIRGETVHKDSIKMIDSLKFTTPKGKVVYGGGGIMPDIFVPADTTPYSRFETAALTSLYMVRYTNSYIDSHRKELNAIKNFRELDGYLSRQSGQIFDGYVRHIESVAKIKPTPQEIAASRSEITALLKAYIGQASQIDNEAFYRYILPFDNILEKGIETARKQLKH